MRIYVAGPYSGPDPIVRERNVERAMAAGLAMLEAGHYPFIPHLLHFFDAWATGQGRSVPYETYLQWDAEFLAGCEGLLYLGASPGAERELELAVQLGKPILSRFSAVLPTDRPSCSVDATPWHRT